MRASVALKPPSADLYLGHCLRNRTILKRILAREWFRSVAMEDGGPVAGPRSTSFPSPAGGSLPLRKGGVGIARPCEPKTAFLLLLDGRGWDRRHLVCFVVVDLCSESWKITDGNPAITYWKGLASRPWDYRGNSTVPLPCGSWHRGGSEGDSRKRADLRAIWLPMVTSTLEPECTSPRFVCLGKAGTGGFDADCITAAGEQFPRRPRNAF